ncbi:hypothetical protein CYMTET_23323 [Cymbomonas tetramitiformis]|uniref:Uncharacterized protein n=1 Tax=Cymbomonas tetramitiformis TaxID=36881 RepID=A0AAE0FY46_9CHLO|nr:hypothetical protein CYMTET_23323 [Cymbomonas tetramitiformis]
METPCGEMLGLRDAAVVLDVGVLSRAAAAARVADSTSEAGVVDWSWLGAPQQEYRRLHGGGGGVPKLHQPMAATMNHWCSLVLS